MRTIAAPGAAPGGVFLAYPATAASPPAGAMPVCRFYRRPVAGVDSHFYSASAAECDHVRQNLAHAWLLETANAFGAMLPDATSGACPPATVPVYRIFNNRADANHRFGLSRDLASLTPYHVDSGPWVAEGYDPSAVALCAPR